MASKEFFRMAVSRGAAIVQIAVTNPVVIRTTRTHPGTSPRWSEIAIYAFDFLNFSIMCEPLWSSSIDLCWIFSLRVSNGLLIVLIFFSFLWSVFLLWVLPLWLFCYDFFSCEYLCGDCLWGDCFCYELCFCEYQRAFDWFFNLICKKIEVR